MAGKNWQLNYNGLNGKEKALPSVHTVNNISYENLKKKPAQLQNSKSQEAFKPYNAEKVSNSWDLCNIVETSKYWSSQISTLPSGSPSTYVGGLLPFTSTNKDPEKVICRTSEEDISVNTMITFSEMVQLCQNPQGPCKYNQSWCFNCHIKCCTQDNCRANEKLKCQNNHTY